MKMSTMSIRWKILPLVLLGPVIIGGILAGQWINDIRSGAEEAIISKSAGIVLMAEATQRLPKMFPRSQRFRVSLPKILLKSVSPPIPS